MDSRIESVSQFLQKNIIGQNSRATNDRVMETTFIERSKDNVLGSVTI